MSVASPQLKSELKKAWRLGTAFLRARPDFILPGAPKCATSSLYDWLGMHPLVRRGVRKEPANFIHYPTSELRSRMNFPLLPPLTRVRFLTGEASVEYFSHPHAAENIQAILPDVRLIFLLRDPVQRAWSDYRMFVESKAETEEFETIVDSSARWLKNPDAKPLVNAALKNAFNPVRYLANGLYAEILARWFQFFSREQCIILFQEDFLIRPKFVQERVLRHLRLPLTHPAPFPHARKGHFPEKMRPETQAFLKDFYREPDDRLEDFLGIQLPWRTYG
ncbi:MAG: hypothetical protein C5B47_03420 [Verrucomicrobia bacterium]|nr:MAG: hypothetical protein C5B47_03420 [Verrucomicrobiota bacterium]